MLETGKKQNLSLKEAAKISGYASDYIGWLIRNKKIKGKKIESNTSWIIPRKEIIEYCQKTKREIKNLYATKKYLSLKEAAQISGYHSDYIGYLIRKGKVKGKKVCSGISWLTTENTLKSYIEYKRKKIFWEKKISGLPLDYLLRRVFYFSLKIPVYAILGIVIFGGLIAWAFVPKAQPPIIEIYSSQSEGNWQNSQNVVGPPDVGPEGDFSLFSESNSAVYKNGTLELICEKFGNENLINYDFQSAKIKFSFAIGEKEPDIIIEQPATSDQQQETSSSSRKSISFWYKVKNLFVSFVNRITLLVIKFTSIVKAEEINSEEGSIETNVESIDTETSVEQLSEAKEELTQEEIIQEEPIEDELITEETPREEQPSQDILPDLDAKITIWWSLDGINWQILDTISSYSLSNALNGGYFEYHAPFLKNWGDVKNLKIKFQGTIGGETNLVVYLDSVWVEAAYEEKTSEQGVPITPPEQPPAQSTEEQPPAPEESEEKLPEVLSEEISEEIPEKIEEPPKESEEVKEKEEVVKKLPKIKIKENSLIFVDQEKEDFSSVEEPFFVVLEPEITLQELISSGKGELIEEEITQINIPIAQATSTTSTISTTPIIPVTSTEPAITEQNISATSTTSTELMVAETTSTAPLLTTSSSPLNSTNSDILSTSTESTTFSTSSNQEEESVSEEAPSSGENKNTENISPLIEQVEPSTSTENGSLPTEEGTLGRIKRALKRGFETIKLFAFNVKNYLKYYLEKIASLIVPKVKAQTVNTPNIKIKVFEPRGRESFLNPQITPQLVDGKEGFEIKLPKPERDFRPGKWRIEVELETEEAILVVEKYFTWGVLAINVNKSIYLSGEQAYLQMAALRDDGHTICDANLKLEITSPGGNIIYPEIQMSGECGSDNVTDKPDYFVYYQVGEVGVYQMKLKNLDTDYEITDFFEVRESVPFEVERIGPTRIYPPVSYEMKFKIKVNQDFVGEVIETKPESFDIKNQNAKIKITNQNSKNIVWEVDWKEGENYELSYQFDAPDVSPYIYLLGPLEIGDFQEIRQWQIASDSPDTKKIAQQINIIDQEYNASTQAISPTNNSLGIIRWDGTKYSDETVYFEAVIKTDSPSAALTEAYLYTTGGVEISGSKATTTSMTYTRARSLQSITLTDGTDYTVRIKDYGGGAAFPSIKAARLIIVQSTTTAGITNTQTQIEVGNVTSTSATSYITLTNPKIYKYDSSKFSPTPVTITFEATMKAETYEGTPTSVGPNSPSTGSTEAGGGSVDWTGPTRATSSDNYRATTSLGKGVISYYLKATGFNFNIPAGATIKGIKVEIERSIAESTSNVTDNSVKIIKAGTITGNEKADTATYWPVNSGDAYATYPASGWETDTWGVSWTSADINSSNFGAAVQAKNTVSTKPTTETPQVDHIRITVRYTSSETATTSAQLYNKTDSVVVSGSQISVASTTWLRATSSAITLTPDREYLVQVQTSNANATGSMANAKIVLTQSSGSGIDKVEMVHQYINTATTTTATVETKTYFDNYYNPGNWAGGPFTHYFEATMQAPSGSTIWAELWTEAGYYIANSEISTTTTAYVRQRSANALTMPTSATNTDTITYVASGSGKISTSWLIIQASGLIPFDVTVSATGNQASSMTIPSTDNYVGGAFVITENTSSRNVTRITIAEAGSVDAQNNLSNIRLFYDLDTTPPYDCTEEQYNAGSDLQYGTASSSFNGTNGIADFTGSVTISTTQTMCVYVVLDVGSGASEGNKLEIQISNPSTDVVVSGGGTVGPTSAVEIPGTTNLQYPATTITQRAFIFENDDGTTVNSNSDMDSANTTTTDVKKGQRLVARFQIDETGGIATTTSFKVQYDKNDGRWTDLNFGGAPNTNSGASSSDWNATTVDSMGDVGKYSSIAIGNNGITPIFSYYDNTNGNLNFGKCTNLSCTTGITTTTIPDSTGDVGKYSSIALGSDGRPVISYYDDTENNLSFAKCQTESCTQTTDWSTTTIPDSTGDVGKYSSIAIGTDDYPVVAYRNESNGWLNIAKCNSGNCTQSNNWSTTTIEAIGTTTANVTTIDSAAASYGNPGRLLVEVGGYYFVFFRSTSNNYLVYRSSTDGTNWSAPSNASHSAFSGEMAGVFTDGKYIYIGYGVGTDSTVDPAATTGYTRKGTPSGGSISWADQVTVRQAGGYWNFSFAKTNNYIYLAIKAYYTTTAAYHIHVYRSTDASSWAEILDEARTGNPPPIGIVRWPQYNDGVLIVTGEWSGTTFKYKTYNGSSWTPGSGFNNVGSKTSGVYVNNGAVSLVTMNNEVHFAYLPNEGGGAISYQYCTTSWSQAVTVETQNSVQISLSGQSNNLHLFYLNASDKLPIFYRKMQYLTHEWDNASSTFVVEAGANDQIQTEQYPSSLRIGVSWTYPSNNRRFAFGGDLGFNPSIAIGTDGNPIVSYYHHTTSTDNLKILKCGNKACNSDNSIYTLDSVGSVGLFSSIAIGADGKPIIAYFDDTNDNLNILKCGDSYCSLGNTTTTVDSTGNVGLYTSIAIGTDGYPVVSYHDKTNGALKVLKCGNSACTSGNTITVIDGSTSNVGSHASIAIAPDGWPVVSYYDDDNDDLKVAKMIPLVEIQPALGLSGTSSTTLNATAAGDCTGGTTWQNGVWYEATTTSGSINLGANKCTELAFMIDTSEATASTTYRLRLVYGNGNTLNSYVRHPAFTLASNSNNTKRYSKEAVLTSASSCALSDWNCRTITVMNAATYGYPAIAIGTDGYPVIAYWTTSTNDLAVAKCNNTDCTSVSTTTVDTVGDVGLYTSIAIGTDGYPIVSYFDYTNNYNLNIAKCISGNCTQQSNWTTTTVDTTGQVGYETSIAIGTDGYPIVSYLDLSNYNLNIAKCISGNCTQQSNWVTTTVDTAGDVGDYTSIAIGTDGYPIVSYRDVGNYNLNIAKCISGNCTQQSNWTTTTVDETGNVGKWTSIAIGTDGYPIVSYCDYSNSNLKIAKQLGLPKTAISYFNNYIKTDKQIKLTRNQWTNATTGALILEAHPAIEDGLTYFFDKFDYVAVTSTEGTASTTITSLGGTSTTTPLFVFSEKHLTNTEPLYVKWTGQSTVGADQKNIVLQVYRFGSASSTTGWKTVTTKTTGCGGTNCDIFGSTTTDLTDFYYPYYKFDPSRGSAKATTTANIWGTTTVEYWTFWRVYQTEGVEILKTDYWTLRYESFPSIITQRAFIFENDDGTTVNSNSDMDSANTTTTDVKKGQRLVARFQIDETGGIATTTSFKVQYDKNDGRWTDLNFGGAPNINSGASSSDWNATTVDSTGNVGQDTSIVIGTDGYPVISYDRQADLGIYHCTSVDCSSGSATTVDTGTFGYTSIAIGNDGYPIMSFSDLTYKKIMVYHCTSIDCSSGSATTVDGALSVDYPSIAIGTDGYPVISYQASTTNAGELRVAKCNNTACTNVSTTTIISVSGEFSYAFARYTSIAIGTDGYPVISYYDSINDALGIAHCNNTDCTSTSTTSVDSGNVGDYIGTSIAIGTDGYPVISYYNKTAQALKVYHCTSVDCSSGNAYIVDDPTYQVGRFSSIAIGTDGYPIISYWDYGNYALKVVKCNDIACSGQNETATIVDTGSTTWFGSYTSITVSPDGWPIVSYYDGDNGDLKVAKMIPLVEIQPALGLSGTSSTPLASNEAGTCESGTSWQAGEWYEATTTSNGINLGASKCTELAFVIDTSEAIASTTYRLRLVYGNGGTLNSYQRFPAFTLASNSNNTKRYSREAVLTSASSCAVSDYACTTVDETGTVGKYTSIAIGTDGNPIISYYDATTTALKVAKCNNTICSSVNIATVDSLNIIGLTSIAIGTDGYPVISYYDTNGALRVAKCGDPSCTSGNTTTTVDSSISGTESNTSIAIGTDGYPVISYFFYNNADLIVAKCGNPSCTSGNTTTTVDSVSSVGMYNSITIGTDGNPVISYYLGSIYNDLIVAKCGNPSCTSGNTTTTVDETGNVGQHTSIAIGTDGYPIVAYYDIGNLNLNIAKCTTGNCTQKSNWATTTVDETGDVGSFASIAIGTDGYPIVAYYDDTNDNLKVTKALGLPKTAIAYFNNYYRTDKQIKLTRNQWTNATTGALILEAHPAIEDGLTYFFDKFDYGAVTSTEGTASTTLASSGSGTSTTTPLYVFSDKHSTNTEPLYVKWTGQSTAGADQKNIVLQVYRFGSASSTTGWKTVTIKTTGCGGTNCDIYGSTTTDLTDFYYPYYKFDPSRGSAKATTTANIWGTTTVEYWTFWRVYQDQNVGSQTLKTDYWKVQYSSFVVGINVSGRVCSNEPCTGSNGCSACSAANVVGLSVNGGTPSYQSCNTITGAFSFSTVNVSSGGTITLFLDENAADASAVVIAGSSNINDLDFYENRIVVRAETGSVTISDMAKYDSDQESGDIRFDAETGPADVKIHNNTELHIWTGDTFAPGGTVTMHGNGPSGGARDGDLHLATSSALIAGGDITIAGDLIASSSATFTDNGYGIIFNGSTTREIWSVAGFNLGKITFNGSGGLWNLKTAATSTATTTITTGTLVQASDYDLTLASLTIDTNGYFNKAGGTGKLYFEGTGPIFIEDVKENQNLGDVIIGLSPAVTNQNSDIVVDSLTVNTTDIHNTRGFEIDCATFITVNGTLNATDDKETDGSIISLQTNWTVTGTFTADTSTTTFYGSSFGNTIDPGNSAFNHIHFNGSGGWTFNVSSATTTNDFTISQGTVTSTSAILYIGGNWLVQSGGVFNHNNGKVLFNATAAKNITAGGANFYLLEFNGSGGQWTFQDAATSTATTTITQGTVVQAANYNLTLHSLTIGTNGTFNKASGTGRFYFDGTDPIFINDVDQDNNLGNVYIGYSPATTNQNSNIVVDSLTVNSGDNHNTRGYDIDSTSTITVYGTLNANDTKAGNATLIYVGTNWTVGAGGTFTAGTSTVTFDGGTSGNTITPGTSSFYNLTINNASGGWTLNAFSATTTNDFTITNGTATSSSAVLYVGGNWLVESGGIFKHNNAKVLFNANSTGKTINVVSNSANFYDLEFNNSNGGWTITSGSATTTNNFTITAGIATSTSGILYVSGNWYASSTTATFNHNNGKVLFNATTPNHTITDGGSPFYLITFNGLGGSWLYQDGTSTAPATTTVENGTSTFFNAKTGAVSVTGGQLNVDWYLGVHVVDKDDEDHNINTSGTDPIIISEASSSATIWRHNGTDWLGPVSSTSTDTDDSGLNPQPNNNFAIRIREYSKTNTTTTYYKYNATTTSQPGFSLYNYYSVRGNKYITSTSSAESSQDRCISQDWHRVNKGSVNGTKPYDGVNQPPLHGTWYLGMTSDLQFSVDSSSVNLGTLNALNSWTATNTTILYATTSYTGGYKVTAYEGAGNNGRLKHTTLDVYIEQWSGTNANPTDWDLNCPSSSDSEYCGFGYNTNDDDLGGDSNNDRFVETGTCGTDNKCWAGFAISQPGDRMADSSGPVNGTTTTITYKASVKNTQSAGQYSTTIYYLCTPNY